MKYTKEKKLSIRMWFIRHFECAICGGEKVYRSGQILCLRHANQNPLVQIFLSKLEK